MIYLLKNSLQKHIVYAILEKLDLTHIQKPETPTVS